MKVLHLLSTGTIGGIEVLCRDMAVIAPQENIYVVMFKPGPIEEQIRQTGAKCYDLCHISKYNTRKYLRNLVEICREEKIDIVVIHHEGLTNAYYYMQLRKEMPELKYIRYMHSVFDEKYYYDSNPLVNAIKRKYYGMMLEKSDKLIAVSECVKKSFETNFHIAQGKIEVVYNGMLEKAVLGNKESYMSREIVKKSTDEIKVVYIGRLEEVKGIDILLQAFSMVKKEQINCSLTLLGDGAYRNECENMVCEKGLQQSVFFEGFVLDKEKYMESADIFVYPSRWQEAFGISIIEAMSYGVICIASNVGGIPEILQDGVNGFLFENENVFQLKEKLMNVQQLIRDGKKEQISMNAIKTAEKYTIELTVEKLQKIYQNM